MVPTSHSFLAVRGRLLQEAAQAEIGPVCCLQGRTASRVPGRGLRPNSQAGEPQRVPERRLSPMGHPRPVGGVPGNSMWRRSLHPDTGGQLCSRRRVSRKDPVLLRETANGVSAMSSGDMPSHSPSPVRRTRRSIF